MSQEQQGSSQPLVDGTLKGWDEAKETSRKTYNTKSTGREDQVAAFCFKVILFLGTLGGAIVHHGTLLLMVDQVKEIGDKGQYNQPYLCLVYENLTRCVLKVFNTTTQPWCLESDHSSDVALATQLKYRCPVTDLWWHIGLLLSIALPDALNFLQCLYYQIGSRKKTSHSTATDEDKKVKKVKKAKRVALVVALVVEFFHVCGVSLLIFIALPSLDSVVHRIALMSGCALVPSFLNIYRRKREHSGEACSWCPVILAMLSQVSIIVLLLWPLLTGMGMLGNENVSWSILIGISLVSLPFCFNYIKNSGLDKRNNEGNCLDKLANDIYKYRKYVYLGVSLMKVILYGILMIVAMFVLHDNLDYGSCEPEELTDKDLPGLSYVWVWTLLLNLASGMVLYLCGRTAIKVKAHFWACSLPVMATPFGILIFFTVFCDDYMKDECVFAKFLPEYLTFKCSGSAWETLIGDGIILFFLLGWISKLLVAWHMMRPPGERNPKSERVLFSPGYDGMFPGDTLMLNRILGSRVDAQEPAQKVKDKELFFAQTPKLKVAATMWHENKDEMIALLRSLFRLDLDQVLKRSSDIDRYDLECHVFFDDVVDGSGKKANEHVMDFIHVIKEKSRDIYKDIKPNTDPKLANLSEPKIYDTPYGGRMVWDLPGRKISQDKNGAPNKLIVHLKDKDLVKKKKRWSQVMYMYYFLGHEMAKRRKELEEVQRSSIDENKGAADEGNEEHTGEEKKELTKEQKEIEEMLKRHAESTFILALDGDVDFGPMAVTHLLDRMKRDNEVGAVCGRIHPVGSGLMVWYQKFEYALGHWLQKATENCLGSVLCSPGCFSMFRGSALKDDNVMKTYSRKPEEAEHYVQYDLGEDRWLCTLLLKQGYHVEYVAVSDAYTNAPTSFGEFYKQRRRWMPSTMANIYDLLVSWGTVCKNPHINHIYMAYQTLLFLMSFLGSATIFLMVTDALSVAFPMLSPHIWLSVNTVLVVGFIITCFKCSDEVQIFVAMLLSTFYSVVQAVVLVAVIADMAERGPCSDSFIFFMMVAGSFVLAGILHPKEMSCLPCGLLYFFLVPSMYLVLVIYAMVNLNQISWGVRENVKIDTKKEKNTEKEEKKRSIREFFRWSSPTDESAVEAGLAKLEMKLMAMEERILGQVRNNQLKKYPIPNEMDDDASKKTKKDDIDEGRPSQSENEDESSEKTTSNTEDSHDSFNEDHIVSRKRGSNWLKKLASKKPLPSIRNTASLGRHDTADTHDVSQSTESMASGRNDSSRSKSWLVRIISAEEDFSGLDEEETEFFKGLIKKYLNPIEEDNEERKMTRLKDDFIEDCLTRRVKEPEWRERTRSKAEKLYDNKKLKCYLNATGEDEEYDEKNMLTTIFNFIEDKRKEASAKRGITRQKGQTSKGKQTPRSSYDSNLDAEMNDAISKDEKELLEGLRKGYNSEEEQTKLEKNLKKLRDSVCFGYFLTSIMYIVTIYTMKQFQVRIPWFCVADGVKDIDPVGFIFILLFGIILIVQTLGMIWHRIGSLIQIAASEEAQIHCGMCCGTNKVHPDQPKSQQNNCQNQNQSPSQFRTEQQGSHQPTEHLDPCQPSTSATPRSNEDFQLNVLG